MKKKILSLIISSIVVIGGGATAFLNNSKYNTPSDASKETKIITDSSEDVDVASSDSQIVTEESNEQSSNIEDNADVHTNNNGDISASKSRVVNDTTSVKNSGKINNQQLTSNKGHAPNRGQAPNKGQASNEGTNTGSNNNSSSNKPAEKPSNQPSGLPAIPQNHSVEFLAQVENEILTLCNNERGKAGLKPLVMDETMRRAARYKAEEMLQYGYFDHNSPYTGTPFQLLQKFNVSYNTAGENIQSSTGAGKASVTAETIVSRWMNSSGHRANILNSNFGRMGIGVVFSPDGNLAYESQLFAN